MSNPSPLESIFFAALEKPSSGDRVAFLDEACAGNVELRGRVERMLAAQAAAGSFLERPAQSPDVTADQPLPEKLGTRIGPYKLREVLGEGGMGTVFAAEQEQPIRRKVALKIIKPGMDTRQVLGRFETERQTLALMDHPHIAKVLDAGTTESGRPYFVMELVRGVPITEFCDQRRLDPRQRLELYIQVCRAIQHAHQKGIIHRDIKPTNILVTLHDELAVPKVIDFGIAKATEQRLTEQSVYTELNQMIGTPLYMSPEQAELNALDVDTRSDVYSLGVLLYELLTGSTPFDSETLRQASFDEMRRLIREVDPPRPSQRVSTLNAEADSTVSKCRGVDERRLERVLQGELDWIVMKSLEKDRTRRYESASALAADVERYLHDEPVQACPPSTVYRLKKSIRRNKVGLSIAASVCLSLGVTGGLLGWAARDRALRRTAIEQELETALQTSVTLQELSKWPEALAVVQGVQTVSSENTGSPELRQRVESRLADLLMVLELEKIALVGRTLDFGDEKYYLAAPETEREYARAFREFGVDVEKLPPAQVAELIRARSIRAELVAGLEYWAVFRSHSDRGNHALRNRLLEIAGSLDPDPWRGQLRAAWLAGGPDKTIALLTAADNEDRPMSPLMLGAMPMLDLFGHGDQAVKLLRKAWFRRPDDFWVLFELGSMSPNPDDAIRFCTAALAIRPHTEALHNELSARCYSKKYFDEAIAHAREAIRLRPEFASAHFNLGLALADTGLHDEAIVAYHAAIHSAPNFWQAHYRLADELRKRGLADEAIAEYRTTIGIKFDVLPAHGKLWGELGRKGLLDQRLVEYREALRLTPDATQSLMERLGRAFLEFQDYAAAEAVVRECLASSETTHPEAWTTFSRKSLLGGVLLEQAVSLKTTKPAAAETKLAEAEPLLLAAYAGLKAREAKIASSDKIPLTEALERLVKLYTQRDKPDEAARWQKELDARRPKPLPSAESQPKTTKPKIPN